MNNSLNPSVINSAINLRPGQTVHQPNPKQVSSQAIPSGLNSEPVPPQQQLDPFTHSTAETWLSIASLAETLGDADRAAMAYDATLQYNPSSTKALTSLAHLYRSRDMFQRAAELYQRALSINPELGDIWATLGHCYLMLDDLQRAYAAYQQALYHLNNPNVPKLWHGIGILYDRYGSLDYAEEAFAKVLELDPQFEKANEIYFRLGIIYKHQCKWNQALECFRYILPQPPAPLQEWDVWFQLGGVLEAMGEWQGAREAYEHVLLQNDRHAKVLQQLGCLYGMNSALFYDPQTSLNLLLKSLEIDASDATTWYHLGRIHMVRNDYTAAYDAFQQAVNRDSRNPTFWCSIGVLYYQISQYRDALDAYTRAIRLNPYISEVWYDLGTLYETCNNQLNDALDAYRQAARLDPNNIHIRERLESLTSQLADQSPGGIQSDFHKGPAPVMLQPTLQTPSDQINPLNKNSTRNGVPFDPSLLSSAHYPQQPTVNPQKFSHIPNRDSNSHNLQSNIQISQQLITPSAPGLSSIGNTNKINIPSLSLSNAPQSIPKKRPIEGGMNTLVNAISQQEQQQKYKEQKQVEKQLKLEHVSKHEQLDSKSINDINQKETTHEVSKNRPISILNDENLPSQLPHPPSKKLKNNASSSPDQYTIMADVSGSKVSPADNFKQRAVATERVISPTLTTEELTKTEKSVKYQKDAESSTIKSTKRILNEDQTIIKPSFDAIEKMKEEVKLREEDEQENNEVIKTNDSFGTDILLKENIVREVEEDENYDE